MMIIDGGGWRWGWIVWVGGIVVGRWMMMNITKVFLNKFTKDLNLYEFPFWLARPNEKDVKSKVNSEHSSTV